MIKYDLLNQFLVIINSACLGGMLALIYDMFSFFEIVLGIKICYDENRIVKKFQLPFKATMVKKVVLIVFDMAYFLIITPVCAIFLYSESFGILRWYYVGAALIGVLLYRLSLGIIVKKFIIISGTLIRHWLNSFLMYAKRKTIKIFTRLHKNRDIKNSPKREMIKLCSTSTGKIKGRAD